MKRFFEKDSKVRLVNGNVNKYREIVMNFKKVIAIIIAVSPAENKEPSALLCFITAQIAHIEGYIEQYEALERLAAKDYLEDKKSRKAEFMDRQIVIKVSTMSESDKAALIEVAVNKFENSKNVSPTKSL